MSDDRIRVFAAIELPCEAKRGLVRAIDAIDALGVAGVRAARPDGIHLTLAFLGDVDADAIPDIVEGIGRAASRSAELSLSLGETGAFPSPASARVIWAGVGGEVDRLRRLQSDVEAELRPLGYRPDRRGFNPHVTIARVRGRVPARDLRRVMDAASSLRRSEVHFRVGSIHLIRSTLHPDGAIYTSLHAARLGVEKIA